MMDKRKKFGLSLKVPKKSHSSKYEEQAVKEKLCKTESNKWPSNKPGTSSNKAEAIQGTDTETDTRADPTNPELLVISKTERMKLLELLPVFTGWKPLPLSPMMKSLLSTKIDPPAEQSSEDENNNNCVSTNNNASTSHDDGYKDLPKFAMQRFIHQKKLGYVFLEDCEEDSVRSNLPPEFKKSGGTMDKSKGSEIGDKGGDKIDDVRRTDSGGLQNLNTKIELNSGQLLQGVNVHDDNNHPELSNSAGLSLDDGKNLGNDLRLEKLDVKRTVLNILDIIRENELKSEERRFFERSNVYEDTTFDSKLPTTLESSEVNMDKGQNVINKNGQGMFSEGKASVLPQMGEEREARLGKEGVCQQPVVTSSSIGNVLEKGPTLSHAESRNTEFAGEKVSENLNASETKCSTCEEDIEIVLDSDSDIEILYFCENVDEMEYFGSTKSTKEVDIDTNVPLSSNEACNEEVAVIEHGQEEQKVQALSDSITPFDDGDMWDFADDIPQSNLDELMDTIEYQNEKDSSRNINNKKETIQSEETGKLLQSEHDVTRTNPRETVNTTPLSSLRTSREADEDASYSPGIVLVYDSATDATKDEDELPGSRRTHGDNVVVDTGSGGDSPKAPTSAVSGRHRIDADLKHGIVRLPGSPIEIWDDDIEESVEDGNRKAAETWGIDDLNKGNTSTTGPKSKILSYSYLEGFSVKRNSTPKYLMQGLPSKRKSGEQSGELRSIRTGTEDAILKEKENVKRRNLSVYSSSFGEQDRSQMKNKDGNFGKFICETQSQPRNSERDFYECGLWNFADDIPQGNLDELMDTIEYQNGKDSSKNSDATKDDDRNDFMGDFGADLDDQDLVSYCDDVLHAPNRDNRWGKPRMTGQSTSKGTEKELVSDERQFKMRRSHSATSREHNLERTRLKECPICLESFESRLSHSDIDQHIAKCVGNEEIANDNDNGVMIFW